jgi:uncharacterized protein YdeI (YjbR/CyaY-like superfamily)
MATSKKSPLKRARHAMPAFVKKALDEHGLTEAYKARPPYQKNDYLGWIKSAKQDAIRQSRLERMLAELKSGRKYMNMAWSAKRSRSGRS